MFLANLCNSTIIEIYSDIIQVSHGFDGCQILEYIAENRSTCCPAIGFKYLNPKLFLLALFHRPYRPHRPFSRK